MPVFAAIFLVMTMSSIGLPALNGFIGEILILQGVYVVNKAWAAVAATGIVLGAAYMLWLYPADDVRPDRQSRPTRR